VRRKQLDAKALREGWLACKLGPDDPVVAFQVAMAYAGTGHIREAELIQEPFRKSEGHRWDLYMAKYDALVGRTQEAAEHYRRALDEEERSQASIDGLAELLLRAGRRDEAGRLFDLREPAERSSPASLEVDRPSITRENYQRIGGLLRARGVIWIAMQYPLRRLGPLRALTSGFPETVMIENRENFLRVSRRDPATHLFFDAFAGDFGHCSPAGNRILAQAAAEAVRAAAGRLAGRAP
jgi:hypothetical protein